jgi:hypothetical protein
MNMKIPQQCAGFVSMSTDDIERAAVLTKLDNGGISLLILTVDRNEYRKDQDLIHAAFNDLGAVTLIDCQFSGLKVGAAGYMQTYLVNTVISGHAYSSKSDLQFKVGLFDMGDYGDWLRESFYDHTYDDSSLKTIHFVSPKQLNIPVPDTEECYISWGNSIRNKRMSFEYRQRVFFYISFESVQILSKFFNIRHRLQHIMSMLSGIHASIDLVELDLIQGRRIQCYKKSIASEHNHTFFRGLNFEDVKSDIPIYLSKWLSNSRIASIGDLLLSRYQQRYINLEQDFLNSCFAMESIHRCMYPDRVQMKPDIFKEHMRGLSKTKLDPEFLQLLKNKNRYGYEMTFRSRLRELNLLITDEPQFSKEEIHNIVTQRNFLVHQLTDDIENSFDYRLMTQRMDNSLRFIFLSYLKEADLVNS